MKHPSLSKVKSSDTKPEIVVRKFLFHNGFRYRKHFKTWPRSPDICLTKIKKAIFIHGCFWHRHKDCKLSYFPKTNQEFWRNKFENNIERDRKNQFFLSKKGISFHIIWECEIRQSSNWKKHLLNFIDS